MNERRDLPSADLAVASVSKRKRTKKKPLWCRIIYDDQMVALVRLLGHTGMPLKEMRDKAKPLVEKFGRERLQEAADEIVEIIGDGDDAIVRLTKQAQKLAIQLIGRPRTENSTAVADSLVTGSPPPVHIESETIPPTTETNSETTLCEPNLSTSIATSSASPTASAAAPIESSPTLTREQTEDGTWEWTNYVTSCVAAFLNEDRQFTDECLHLGKQCWERAAHCESVTSGVQTESQARTVLLADQLQRLVCEYNPLADDVSPFSALLDAALSNVDWHDLAESFLKRLERSTEECDDD